MESGRSEKVERVVALLSTMSPVECREVWRRMGCEKEMPEYAKMCVAVMNGIIGRDIMERTRIGEVVWGRYMVMYELVDRGWSTLSVGRVFGMDHSSVVHGRECVREMLRRPSMYKAEMMVWDVFIKRIENERMHLECKR